MTFNINVKEVTNQSLEKLNTFCETFGLSNLVKGYTCYSKTHKSSIYLILTNKTSSFQLTKATETGISDVHLISTYMKTQVTRLKWKIFLYRDCKRFDEKTFLLELESKNLTRNSISSNENYGYLSYQFADVVNKQVLIKTKALPGNNAPFINKHLRMKIYRRSALTNKFNRKPKKFNWEKDKKQRNKCVKLRKRSIKIYIDNITVSGVMSNKTFWRTIRPFLTNKGILIGSEISVIHNGKTIDDEKQVAETLNHAYINIVEHTTGNKPTSVLHDTNIEHSLAIDLIINKYETHLSIIPAGIYLLKVNNRNTRTRCEICSKLTIKTPERRLASFWCLYC